MLKIFFATSLCYSVVFLMLTGCATPTVVGDAFSENKKGNAYGYRLQADWTSRTFEVLQSSKIPLQSQKTELMLLGLPIVFAKESCLPSEVLEVMQIPFKATQKEIWKVRVCGNIKDIETIGTVRN